MLACTGLFYTLAVGQRQRRARAGRRAGRTLPFTLVQFSHTLSFTKKNSANTTWYLNVCVRTFTFLPTALAAHAATPEPAHQHNTHVYTSGSIKNITSATSDEGPCLVRATTRDAAPPRSPPQAAGPPQAHERAQLSEVSVEVLRCMRTWLGLG